MKRIKSRRKRKIIALEKFNNLTDLSNPKVVDIFKEIKNRNYCYWVIGMKKAEQKRLGKIYY